MALSFYIIGRKVWQLGKKHGYITPPELIGDRFKSDTLRMIFLLVMVVFTLPYLATQAIGGGIALEELTDGTVTYELGAVIVTAVITSYVMIGGMRATRTRTSSRGSLCSWRCSPPWGSWRAALEASGPRTRGLRRSSRT